MSQATQVLIGTLFGFAGVAVLIAIRLLPRPRTEAEPVHGAFATLAYRYCPAELRTRAAIVHADGTAACLDCGEHIPAGDQ